MRNELTVQFKRDFVEGYDCLWTELVVDGTPIVDFKRYTLDWGVFASHYLETGEYFLVTCTCGVLGCANLREGVLIRDDGHSIHWVVRTTKPTQVFRFEREAYVREIERALAMIQKIYRENADVLAYYERDRLQLIVSKLQANRPQETKNLGKGIKK